MGLPLVLRMPVAGPAVGRREVAGHAYEVAIWSAAQWEALAEADRPADASPAGDYWITLRPVRTA